MCGIGGILYSESARGNLAEALGQMQSHLWHRGPDGEGIYVSADGRAGLVHTRLAILDLSDAGRQPMSSRDGRYRIVFNGEIYNFRELRAELEAEGEVFQTNSDTEVLLRLYQLRGPECVRELAGMFAFAILDAVERVCFLARGPLGVKPLYYARQCGCFAFASELRALAAAGVASRRVSRPGLLGYLLFGSVQEPETLLENVRCLPAGNYLLWKNGELKSRRFWEVEFHAEQVTAADAVALTRKALEESVRRHFVSDVPVSIFLSGGVDSTALVALGRKARSERLRTFCISFDNPALSEGDVAGRTARHFETEHHDWRLDSSTGKSLLRKFLEHLDQPTIDGFNTYCVSKHAHDHGAKVVLSGLGGDELFGGYGSFSTVPRLARMARWATLTGLVRRVAGRVMERHSPQPRYRRLGSFLTGPPSLGAAYWAMRGIFTPREAWQIMRVYLGEDSTGVHDGMMHFPVCAQPTPEDMVSHLELTRYMRNQLLRDSDVMSMAWGLELRVPFVDPRLIESVARIPAAIRVRPGKRLLLEAVPEVPEWVANRPKRGFVFPFEDWIQDEWRDVFARLDTASPVRLQTWYRRWSLFALESFLGRIKLEANSLVPV
jgi:asparagine synthase (glutamine-hydrolysing)